VSLHIVLFLKLSGLKHLPTRTTHHVVKPQVVTQLLFRSQTYFWVTQVAEKRPRLSRSARDRYDVLLLLGWVGKVCLTSTAVCVVMFLSLMHAKRNFLVEFLSADIALESRRLFLRYGSFESDEEVYPACFFDPVS
jgi:hypothetical protein